MCLSKNKRKSRGFTLIEALVALLIVSIGLLGVAGLQATSIVAGHTSKQRSLAVFHVSQIADRIRANRSPAALAMYDATPGNNAFGCSDVQGSGVNVGVNQCSDIELAQEDVFQWQAALDNSFARVNPAVQIGDITVDQATVPATVTISVQWRERDQNPPPSYTIVVRI